MRSEFWPLFGLRVVTPRLELRYADDAGLAALAQLAHDGIHDPAMAPFRNDWTDAEPVEVARRVLRWQWRTRAELTPEEWRVSFVTAVDGEVVGTQDIVAKDFSIVREFETGSWLGRRFQGRGIGAEMRAAVLHFGFAGLGAQHGTSAAFTDNAPSIGVSRKLGYADDGIARIARRGQPAEEFRFRLTRQAWEARRRADITIEGLTDEVRDMLGAAAAPE